MAILTYDREALIAYLSVADDPLTRSPGDLCERHAGRLVLPRSWQLDDRRPPRGEPVAPAAAPEAAPVQTPAAEGRRKRLRAVPGGVRRPAAEREPRRKWAEIEPSLFDAPAADTTTPTPATAEPVRDGAPASADGGESQGDPVWMPRFGPDNELEDEVDASTPLLRRAFGAR